MSGHWRFLFQPWPYSPQYQTCWQRLWQMSTFCYSWFVQCSQRSREWRACLPWRRRLEPYCSQSVWILKIKKYDYTMLHDCLCEVNWHLSSLSTIFVQKINRLVDEAFNCNNIFRLPNQLALSDTSVPNVLGFRFFCLSLFKKNNNKKHYPLMK